MIPKRVLVQKNLATFASISNRQRRYILLFYKQNIYCTFVTIMIIQVNNSLDYVSKSAIYKQSCTWEEHKYMKYLYIQTWYICIQRIFLIVYFVINIICLNTDIYILISIITCWSPNTNSSYKHGIMVTRSGPETGPMLPAWALFWPTSGTTTACPLHAYKSIVWQMKDVHDTQYWFSNSQTHSVINQNRQGVTSKYTAWCMATRFHISKKG